MPNRLLNGLLNGSGNRLLNRLQTVSRTVSRLEMSALPNDSEQREDTAKMLQEYEIKVEAYRVELEAYRCILKAEGLIDETATKMQAITEEIGRLMKDLTKEGE
jgi:hypothetical protein